MKAVLCGVGLLAVLALTAVLVIGHIDRSHGRLTCAADSTYGVLVQCCSFARRDGISCAAVKEVL